MVIPSCSRGAEPSLPRPGFLAGIPGSWESPGCWESLRDVSGAARSACDIRVPNKAVGDRDGCVCVIGDTAIPRILGAQDSPLQATFPQNSRPVSPCPVVTQPHQNPGQIHLPNLWDSRTSQKPRPSCFVFSSRSEPSDHGLIPGNLGCGRLRICSGHSQASTGKRRALCFPLEFGRRLQGQDCRSFAHPKGFSR